MRELVKAMQKYHSRMLAPDRPIAVLLLLGPSGVGKTELVRALAEILLGDRKAITQVDCAEFNHSHEVSKLIGSPPGYLGHNDTPPRLAQENIDRWSVKTVKSTEGSMGYVEKKPNIVLFDEIEEGHEDLFKVMLAIMENAQLHLGNNRTTDFSRTILVLTSNLGSREVSRLLKGSELGFHINADSSATEEVDKKIYEISKRAAKKFFEPKFMNRIDRLIVFRQLDRDSLKQILRIEFGKLKRRVNTGTRFIEMKMTLAAEDFILAEGTSEEYGARELKRELERHVAEPISSLIGTSQLIIGDCLIVDYRKGEMVFEKTHDPIIYRPDTNTKDILTK